MHSQCVQPILEALRREQNWQYLAETEPLLADVARKRSAIETALAHSEGFVQARERHPEPMHERGTASLEVQFGTRLTEQQHRLLQRQQRVRELQARNRGERFRLTLASYGIVALLVMVLLVLLIRATRNRRRFGSQSIRNAPTRLDNHTRLFPAGRAGAGAGRRSGPVVPADPLRRRSLQASQRPPRPRRRRRRAAGDCGTAWRTVRGRRHRRARRRRSVRRCLGGLGDDEVRARRGAFRGSPAAIAHHGAPMPVTMSFVVVRPHHDETLTRLRERTDRARDRLADADDDRG